MNPDVIKSIIRWGWTIAAALLTKWGVDNASVATIGEQVLTIATALLTLVPLAWGVWTHMRAQKIQAVAEMPDVKKVVVTTQALAASIPNDKVTTGA